MAIIPEIGNGHIGAGAPWSRVDFANVAQMAAAGCRRYPSVPAVIFDDGMTIGREQLLLRARAFAGYLLRHSVKGERVAVMRIISRITGAWRLLNFIVANSTSPWRRSRTHCG